MSWLAENAGTLIVSLALLGVIVFVLLRMRKNKKQGKSSCGCSCGSCPMGDCCHKPR